METKVIKKVTKSGKVSYLYYVDDELVRTSGRVYVASTRNGEIFWGRPNLVKTGGVYNMYKDSIAKAKAETLDDVRRNAKRKVSHYKKVLEEYNSEERLEWWRELTKAFGRELNEERAQEGWADDKKHAEEWYKDALKGATEEAILKAYQRVKEYAEHKEKAMEVVYYDITNIQ